LPDEPIAEGDMVTLVSTANANSPIHGPSHRNKPLPQERKKKPGEVTYARVRRGAVVPGTKASRHPNDPEPPEPFSITVTQGGVVVMEMVAHCGRRKRACPTAVLGQGAVRFAAEEDRKGWRKEEKEEDARLTEVQAAAAATEKLRVNEGGRELEQRWSRATAASGRRRRHATEKGLAGTSKRSCLGGERDERQWNSRDENGEETNIAVVIADEEALDGVHGAPVFVGGRLFGFAIQVCVTKSVGSLRIKARYCTNVSRGKELSPQPVALIQPCPWSLIRLAPSSWSSRPHKCSLVLAI